MVLFSMLIINPNLFSSDVVCCKLFKHFKKVSPRINQSSKYNTEMCPLDLKNDKIGFIIFVKINGAVL